MNEGLILLYEYEQERELRDLFPTIQVISIASLEMISLFKESEIICIITKAEIDLDVRLLEIFGIERCLKFLFVTGDAKINPSYLNYGYIIQGGSVGLSEMILKLYKNRIYTEEADYQIEERNRSFTINGVQFKVRNTAFLIFLYLICNKNKICTREELKNYVYEQVNINSEQHQRKMPKDRAIDVQVHYLRKTLNDSRIKTITNSGYMFQEKK